MPFVERCWLLLKISRPLFWIVGPATWFAGFVHSGNYRVPVAGYMYATAMSIPFCLMTFGVNDVYDYASDARNQRKSKEWSYGHALKPKSHAASMRAARVSAIVILLATLPVVPYSPEVLLCTLAMMCLNWNYSAPPLRLKERPVLDSLSNGLIMMLIWISGYVFSGETSLTALPEQAAKNGLMVFFYACAGHAVAAMSDSEADASADFSTIATVLGDRLTAIFAMLCTVLATLMVGLESEVTIATVSGAIVSLVIFFRPKRKHLLMQFGFLGTFLAMVVWVLKTVIIIQLGKSPKRTW